MKIKIVQEAERLYGIYGIKSLSMNDLAQLSGTPVKTLNKYFLNKESLLKACAWDKINQEEVFSHTEDHSLLDLLVNYAVVCPAIRQKINYRNCSDIRKYYPSIYLFLTEKLNNYAKICQNKVDEGINDGYIKVNINPEIVRAFMQEQLIKLLFDETLPRGCDETLMRDMILAFARGIATLKGQFYIDKKLKTEK